MSTAAADLQPRRIPRTREARTLARQSMLIAGACVVFDSLGYLTRSPGPERWGALELLVLGCLVLADAALATAPARSGWVALAQAALLPALVLVAPERTLTTAGLLISAYRAGAWLPTRTATASLTVMVALLAGSVSWAAMVTTGSVSPAEVVVIAVSNTALPWLVGRSTTTRKAYVDGLRHQRELTVRDAEAEIAGALAREREAIAADLHDVISHHVSAIGVHAAAARMRLPGADGDTAVRTSLGEVETSSRAAMTDLRRLLELLHGQDPADQPGLDQLPELLAGVRATGMDVRFMAYDEPRPLDPAVDLALYRTAQEMLTNARRHGDGSVVRLELEHLQDGVVLTARNRVATGTVPARDRAAVVSAGKSAAGSTGTGRGLAGIRRRAEALGGFVEHGVVEDQYWQTTVSMPRRPRA